MNEEMFRESLLQRFEVGFSERFGEFVRRNNLYAEALRLAFDPDRRVAFRASYALESAFFADPDSFRLYISQFVEDFMLIVDPSAHRHYAKIMYYMLEHKIVELSDEQCNRVVEVAFDHLINPRTRVAVKVWAMDIIYILSKPNDWVSEQLYDTIQHIMSDGTPGIISRGVKVCRKVRQRNEKADNQK